jgi:hypothetical protein
MGTCLAVLESGYVVCVYLRVGTLSECIRECVPGMSIRVREGSYVGS